MKKLFLFLYIVCFIGHFSFAQVGIGTNSPNTKAALDIKSTDKGVLFPRLGNSERNAIASPPNGLHIYNTDDRCLNYFDSVYQIWNCYCFDCQTIIINITSNACKVDFYNSYAKNAPAKKYIINIAAGVTISGCGAGDTALSFSSMPFNASIIINNNGTIAAAGGKGGNGNKGFNNIACIPQFVSADPGQTGGAAISTKAGLLITVNNSGIIAGGGGGGGGGGSNINGSTFAGGGGGGGAGIIGGTGGNAGGFYGSGTCIYDSQGTTAGQIGTTTTGGSGGNGGTTGNTGGNGGARAQVGFNGTGTGAGTGGAAGKAISGGSGNSLINIGAGQSFGIVD